MTPLLRNIGVLLVSMAILELGAGLFGSLLSLRAVFEGFSSDVIGALMSAYYLGFMFGVWLGVRLIQSIGHVRTFGACAGIAAVAALIHPILVDPVIWVILRIVTGVALAAIFTVIESWISGQATNEVRGQVFSIYMIVNLLAMAAGQILLQVAAPAGFVLFSLAAMLFALALVPVSVSTIPAPSNVSAGEKLTLRRLYRESPLGVVGCFGVGLTNGAIWGLGPAFAHDIGFDTENVSYFMAAIIIGGVILQWPLGYLSDRMDRRIVILSVVSVGAVVSVLIALTAQQPDATLFGLAVLFGGAILSLYSLCVAHTNDWVDRGQALAASSSLLLVFAVGAVVGPLVAGAAYRGAGPAGLFFYIAAVDVAIFGFALSRILKRGAAPVDEKEGFRAVARTTPVVLALDPRTDPSDEQGRGE